MSDQTESAEPKQKSRESTILNMSVRGFITMMVTGTVCYMGLRMIEVKEPLYSMAFLCLGYYFGQRDKPLSQLNQKLPVALLLAGCLLFAGCAFHRTTETTFNEDGTNDRTTFVGISFFNRTAVEGLAVGRRTTNETSTLTIAKGSTETQAEAIKAAGEALGAGIAAGVKKAVAP